MAKILHNYQDERGVIYDNAYFRLGEITINLVFKQAIFTFYGYASKTTRQANKAIIGEKKFVISNPDQFDFYYQKYVKNEINMLVLAYTLANTQKFPTGNTIQIGVDNNNDPVYGPEEKTFFEGADDDWT